MHFSVKKINGTQYHYASDSIYIAKGRSVVKNKSLGRVDSPLELRAELLLDFEKYLIEEESKERLKYWLPRVNHEKGFKYDIGSLEKLRAALNRKKEYLGMLGQSGLEAAFKTDFIYNSNKLEGSKVPRSTIEETVKRGGKKNIEVKNSIDALTYVRKIKTLITIKNIVHLHSILLAHEPHNLGIRNEPVIVGNSETAHFSEITPRLQELLKWYETEAHTIYPPDLAFTFYYRFERIHPFIDGNGRTGRMLMNAILKEHRYHPIIIWNSNRAGHMSAFENAIEGSMHKFLQFMNEQMKTTYKIYSNKIDKAREIERSIEETFFKPSK